MFREPREGRKNSLAVVLSPLAGLSVQIAFPAPRARALGY